MSLWSTPRYAFLNLGHAVTHMLLLLYSTVVLSLGPVLAAGYDELIALSTASFVALGIGTLPAGWLGDRWSRDGMMVVFFLGIGAGAVVTGLADGLLGIGIGLALIGLFAAIYHPVGIALVAESAPAGALGKAMGFNGVFGNLGIAAAGIVAGGLTAWLGWRAAFVVPGVLSILAGLAYLALVRPAPRGAAAPAAAEGAAPSLTREEQLVIVAAILIATLAGGIVFNATTVALPKLVEERVNAVGGSTAGVGGLVTLVFAVAAVAQIVVGHLIDRHALKWVYVAVAALQVPAILLVGVLTGWGLLAGAAAMMLLVFGELPVHDTLIARFTAGPWRSRVYGVTYVLSLGVSALAVPLIAFVHGQGGGFATLFAILGGLAGVVMLCALALPGVVSRRASAAAAA